MNIQSEIQKSIALLRQAEDKIISDRENFKITDDIWTVRNIMDAIHYELHQPKKANFTDS